MKFVNKKLLLFDLDGTLINSIPDLALSINKTMKKLNRNTFSIEEISTWVGNGASTLVNRALSSNIIIDENLDEKLKKVTLDLFLDIYSKNLCVDTIMFDGVKSTLEKLKDKSYTLAIITNKPYDFVEPILKKFEINDLFSLILGGDSLEHKKPNSEPLIYACKKLSFKISEAIMIGDSKNDIIAANSCNMQSIGVSYGYNYDEDINVFKPSIVYDSFEDILKSL